MEVQHIEPLSIATLPFAEVEEITPARQPGDPTLSKVWQAIASSAVMPAPDADKLRAIEPLLASVKQKATPARAIEAPVLSELCGTFPGLFKRLPTGLPAFDAYTGGGLQTSRVHIIGGAPGAHKTSLLTRIAYQWARDGVVVNGVHHEVLVVIFATDEPRHGFLSRIGQIEGLVRANLDNEDTAVSGPAWATIAERLQAVPNLMIFDSRFDAVTVEDLAEFAAERANGRRVVIIVDSLHSAPFRSDAEGHEGPRTRIEARIKAAVNLAVKHRVCFIATSELNRGAYRSRSQAEQVADLAAFKESSGIEYGADLGILLRSVPGENKVIEVSIAKSRLGESEVTFRLERESHLSYREVAMPEDVERGEGREEGDEDGHHRWRILEAIRTSTEALRSANDVYRLLRGNKSRLLQNFKVLVDEGQIVSVGGRLRVQVIDKVEAPLSSSGSAVLEPDGTDGTGEREPVPRGSRPLWGAEPMEPRRLAVPAGSDRLGTTTAASPTGGDPLARAKAAVLAVLHAHPGAPNLDGVRLYTGRDFPAWKLRLAWIELCRGGDIENQGTARGPSWHAVGRPAERAPPT